jgi:hypothetical protein
MTYCVLLFSPEEKGMEMLVSIDWTEEGNVQCGLKIEQHALDRFRVTRFDRHYDTEGGWDDWGHTHIYETDAASFAAWRELIASGFSRLMFSFACHVFDNGPGRGAGSYNLPPSTVVIAIPEKVLPVLREQLYRQAWLTE